MSRDQDKEGTLPSTSPWIVVTPSKVKKVQRTPFLSLEDTTHYHTISPIIPLEDNITMAPRIAKVKEETKPEAKPDKKIPPDPGEPTLHQILENIIPDIEPSNIKSNPREILRGLSRQGITTWKGFILMAEGDVSTITKAPDTLISTSSIRILNHIKQLVWQNMRNDLSLIHI